MSDAFEFHPVIICPTFNNARTLGRVLAGIEAAGLPIIVVDDGCVDQTPEILRSWQAAAADRIVITHSGNLGKAAALRSGFDRADAMGFTHAVTIDTDGQLDPAQIPDLLRVARRFPGALVLGSRDAAAPDYPVASRLGRWASNVLVRWESGARVTDSQCGYRVYPLAHIRSLRCHAARYGFETEILTRAAWAGMAIREVRVDCAYAMPEGRVSHFRQWRDSWACAGMHIRLLARSLMPWPIRRVGAQTGTIWERAARWLSPTRAWRAMRQDPAERSRFAAGLATGVFIANLPLYGVQTLLSLFAARKLRLNPLSVVLGSHLSTPPLSAVLIAGAIATGHCFTHGSLPRFASFDPSVIGYRSLIGSVLLEWAIGGIVCGAAMAMVTFAITWLLLRWLPLRTPEAGGAHRGAPAPIPDCEVAESVA